MTREEVLRVAMAYRDRIPEPHFSDMVAEMTYFDVDDPKMRDKLHRWLGFMQGVLFERRIYSLEELKAHNKTGQVS